MLRVTEIDGIRSLAAEGYGPSAISDQVGVDRKTVRKYLDQEDFSPPLPAEAMKPSKLDPFKGLIASWLEEDALTWHKQRHTAQRVHDRLGAEYPDTYDGSYSLVQPYLEGVASAPCVHRHPGAGLAPGECQVDFGEAEIERSSGRLRVKYLTVSFPFSNAGYLQLFGGETAECVTQGLEDVFQHIGGVPGRLVFDNASGVGRRIGEHIRLAEVFQRFQAHYRFSVTFCNPNAGHEKGHVENKVGTLRRNLLVPVPKVEDLATYNQTLWAACEAQWVRPHYKKGISVADLFSQDRAALRRLPRTPFQAIRYEQVRTDGYGKFQVDGAHFYSSAPEYARQLLVVRIGAHTIAPLAPDQTVISEHTRAFGATRTDQVDVRTTLTRLSRNPGAWMNSSVREAVPERLRTSLDTYARADLKTTLGTFAAIAGRYGWEVAVRAVDEAVARGRSVPADAAVLPPGWPRGGRTFRPPPDQISPPMTASCCPWRRWSSDRRQGAGPAPPGGVRRLPAAVSEPVGGGSVCHRGHAQAGGVLAPGADRGARPPRGDPPGTAAGQGRLSGLQDARRLRPPRSEAALRLDLGRPRGLPLPGDP